MASESFESDYLFGLHDPGGEQLMAAAGKRGWILFTEAIGYDPAARTGKDFRAYSNQGYGIICRLNNGYYPNGTIPSSSFYGDFARRCANFVAASSGCAIWIIGNEPNYEIERPQTSGGRPHDPPPHGLPPLPATPPVVPPRPRQLRREGFWAQLVELWRELRGQQNASESADEASGDEPADAPRKEPLQPEEPGPDSDPFFHGLPERFSALLETDETEQESVLSSGSGEVITPDMYARCYRGCRDAIKRVSGHEHDQVLVAAVAPWNNQTRYPANPNGDWVIYLRDILTILGPDACDGFALHTYTHNSDPALITSESRMNPPFGHRRYEFRAYQDFLDSVPVSMRHLPVYITETDQDVSWFDANTGWVQRAYAEIDGWNRRVGTQKIRSLILYRWPRFDRWYIEGKQGVIQDFRQAMVNDYRWRRPQEPAENFARGTQVRTTTIVNLRRSPGIVGKGPDDLIMELGADTVATVLDARPQRVDDLWWWLVQAATPRGALTGWLAQSSPTGVKLLVRRDDGTSPPPPRLQVGGKARTLDIVRMRRTPGYVGKPDDDVIADIPHGVELSVLSGPQTTDGLTWWRMRGRDATGAQQEGWMAENSPTGAPLLEPVAVTQPPPPPPPPPPPVGRFKVGDLAVTVNYVRLRKTPGFLDKPPSDIVADIWQGTQVKIVGGPRHVDDLIWWEVDTTDAAGTRVRGWMAEDAPGGVPLLRPITGPTTQEPFVVGQLATIGQVPARVRKTPGVVNKPDDDVVGEFGAATTLRILGGPRNADDLIWWECVGIANGVSIRGWVAQSAPGGIPLVIHARKLPGTDIPNRRTGTYIGRPYAGVFGISQLWGENPGFYSRYSYDGVPLKGHNGVDFYTPSGTPVLACDGGEVSLTGFEPGGFGNFVLLNHSWGQSIYAHLEAVRVQPGQSVTRGMNIGISGNTGASSGPHLHFAIRILPYDRTDGWGGYSDPLPYMNPADFQLPSYFRDPQTEAVDESADAPKLPPPGMAEDEAGVVRP